MGGVASTAPYANHFTLIRMITIPAPHHSIFAGQMLFLCPTNSVKVVKVIIAHRSKILLLIILVRSCHTHSPPPFKPQLPCSYLAKSWPQPGCLPVTSSARQWFYPVSARQTERRSKNKMLSLSQKCKRKFRPIANVR